MPTLSSSFKSDFRRFHEPRTVYQVYLKETPSRNSFKKLLKKLLQETLKETPSLSRWSPSPVLRSPSPLADRLHCCSRFRFVPNLITCPMDPFDDILAEASAPRARPAGKFMLKAKPKKLPRKEIIASEHATLSKDGKIEQAALSSTSMDPEETSPNECYNAVASTLSTSAEESTRSHHHPQVEPPNMEDGTNSEMGNPQQVSVERDTAALVDAPTSMITASEVDTDWNFTNLAKSACEADSVSEVAPVTNFIPKINLNNGAAQPVQPANAVENVLSNVVAPSTTCSTIGRMEESPKNGEGSFLDSNKQLELTNNSLEVGPDLIFKSTSDNKIEIFESNIHSNFNFEKEREVESVEFELDAFSNVLLDPGARNARKFLPKIKSRSRVGTTPAIASVSSNVMIGKSAKLPTSCTNEVQSFSGDGSSGLNQSTDLPLPTPEIIRTTDLPHKFDYMSLSIPFSEDNGRLEAVIPSQLDSPNPMLSEVADCNGTRDWPSSFGKPAGETADIFSGLESLDDFLTQAATDTGKPALHSFDEKGTEENFVIPACNSVDSFDSCDTTQVQKCSEHHFTQDSLTFNAAAVVNEDDACTNNRSSEAEEVANLNPACPVDVVFDYQSMKSGAVPTSEIPVHEELTNAADSPTLADFLHADVAGENEDANERNGTLSSSLRKHKRSSISGEEDKDGKTSRQLRKQASRKSANNSVNEDVDDLDPPYNPNRDELEENGGEFEVDNSSKNQRASKKKSVAKNGETSKKRKANEDLEKTTKKPPKKFSHSTQRRKRCVDRALLEIPEDDLDPLTLPIKHIILLAEHRERLAKKEASTSKTSSANKSGGDFRRVAGANNEEMLGSEDDRNPDDDEAGERIQSTASLFNYQSFMDKAPRGKWSKEDTDNFYKAISAFGTDFSVVQQLFFPDRTRHQIKLKYKKEERQNPLLLSDALNNRAKDPSLFKLLIERLPQAPAKVEQDLSKDASDFIIEEEVEDLTPVTNDEVATTEQDATVKDQEDSMAIDSPEQSDDSDDDFQGWSQYKSNY